MMKVLLFFLLSCIIVSCSTNKPHLTAESWEAEESSSSLPNIRLHDIWVLESITGKVLKMKHESPRLEIFVSEKRFSGFDGCNEFSGEIVSLDTVALKFEILERTLAFCSEIGDVPEFFNRALSATKSYSISKMKLHLYGEEGIELMLLKKVD